MNEKTPSKISVRARLPYLSLAGILVLVAMTFGNAAANMLPFHLPTKHELQQAEQQEVASARRARIAQLLAEGDHCKPEISRELARALVFDGQSARPYAADHERRCGADPIIDRWANAPQPRAHAPE